MDSEIGYRCGCTEENVVRGCKTHDAGQSEVERLRGIIDVLQELANEAERKGAYLQQVPELKLTGNAYVGMAQRIRAAITGEGGA